MVDRVGALGSEPCPGLSLSFSFFIQPPFTTPPLPLSPCALFVSRILLQIHNTLKIFQTAKIIIHEKFKKNYSSYFLFIKNNFFIVTSTLFILLDFPLTVFFLLSLWIFSFSFPCISKKKNFLFFFIYFFLLTCTL